MKRDGAEERERGGLTLASVSLLTSCGVNRLQSYVVDMIAIARRVRCCEAMASIRRHCLKRMST